MPITITSPSQQAHEAQEKRKQDTVKTITPAEQKQPAHSSERIVTSEAQVAAEKQEHQE